MILRTAEFSPCRTWRYLLSRTWQSKKPKILFICLNPSTATEIEDDPTIIRCMRFAHSWGYGGMVMGNLFAFRTKEPAVMKAAADPVGPENDAHVLRSAQDSALVVAAWGVHGDHRGRARSIVGLLRKENIKIHCLGITKEGHPKHPLFLPKTSMPELLPRGLRYGI
ncbi:MAG: DUF1643 domain-containing protein [Syntrophobacteraceae bacterium]